MIRLILCLLAVAGICAALGGWFSAAHTAWCKDAECEEGIVESPGRVPVVTFMLSSKWGETGLVRSFGSRIYEPGQHVSVLFKTYPADKWDRRGYKIQREGDWDGRAYLAGDLPLETVLCYALAGMCLAIAIVLVARKGLLSLRGRAEVPSLTAS